MAIESVLRLAEHRLKEQELYHTLLQNWRDGFLQQNGTSLTEEFQQMISSGFFGRLFGKGKIFKVASASGTRAGNKLSQTHRIKIPVYRAAKAKQISICAESIPYFETEIGEIVKECVRQEAPINEALLTRRVMQHCGISRAGSKIQGYMKAIYKKLRLKSTIHNGEIIYWKSEQKVKSYYDFRQSGDAENKRDVKLVPVYEMLNSICYVLHRDISMEDEELVREAAKLMGYTRMGKNVVELYTDALHMAEQRSLIRRASNGNYILTDAGTAWGNSIEQQLLSQV